MNGPGFPDAVDVLMLDATLSVAARFTAALGEAPVDCRAIIVRTDPDIQLRGLGVRNPAWKARLPQAQVPTQPANGATLEILEGLFLGTYAVHGSKEVGFAPWWDCDLGARA